MHFNLVIISQTDGNCNIFEKKYEGRESLFENSRYCAVTFGGEQRTVLFSSVLRPLRYFAKTL